jgi:flagellar hook-length control protein FliK
MFEAEAKQAADQFGGGKLDKEHFVEVDEDTLLNALAEELGSDVNAPSGGSAAKVADNFGGGATKGEAIKEARRQQRRAKAAAKAARINEAKARKLKKELNESNLFNAKLLYVNKLMQQHDLNGKQQRAIVEAIDNAKTLREAKLLYTSLTESLRKRAANKASLNESAVRTGSASKSLRSSAPAKSGESLDRWAVLAGINK